MKISPGNMLFQLARKKQFAFRDARGVYVECVCGTVWITVEGQAGDFLLSKGERLCIESNGLALVQGLPSGSIRLVNVANESIRYVNKIDRVINGIASLFLFVRVGNQ